MIIMSFTLQNLKRDSEQDNLYNLFKRTYVDATFGLNTTYVKEEENMRLDKVSKRLYGSSAYIEELMQMNNILNVWNIKQNDPIQYGTMGNLSLLKDLEKELDKMVEEVAKPSKNTRIDPERQINVPPTIKPKSLENLTYDEKTKKIKINSRIS